MPSSQTPILSLPGAGKLLSDAFRIYKSRIGVFLGIAAIPTLVSLFYAFLFTVSRPFPFSTVLMGGFLIIGIIVSLWAQVALFYAVKERDRKIGIKEALDKGWHKLLSYFWISLLSGFIVAGGLLLFIIPGIILSIYFSLAAYVLVSESKKGTAVLFRSKQLVKGYWWKVFRRLLVLSFVLGLIAVPINIIAEIFDLVFIASIISMLIAPFSVIFVFLIYDNLKQIKNGVPFEPPKRKTKILWIILGIIGILLIFVIIVASILFPTLWDGLGRKLIKDAKVMVYMHDIKAGAEFAHILQEGYSEVNCSYPKFVSACNNIAEQLGEQPIIYSSKDAYCGYVKLLSGDYYFCIDSAGAGEKTNIDPEGVGYCDGTTFVCPQ